MPSIAEAPPSSANGRKRRRDDPASASLQSQNKIFSPFGPLSHHPTLSSLPPASFPCVSRDTVRNTDRRLAFPKSRSTHDTKRQRIETIPSQPGIQDIFLNKSGLGQLTSTATHSSGAYTANGGNGKVDLSRCHICFRKPTIRSELDDYANCENCGRRTCYICMRECEAPGLGFGLGEDRDLDALEFEFDKDREEAACWHTQTHPSHDEGIHINDGGGKWEKRTVAHKGMICSRCCIEDGPEGEVRCLGCLQAAGS